MVCDPPRVDIRPEWFRPADLEALAPLALRGARNPDELEETLEIATRHGLRSALPQIAALATKSDLVRIRSLALAALGSLDHRESLPLLLRSAKDPDPEIALAGLFALRQLGARDASPAIATLLGGTDRIREEAFQFLIEARSAELVPELRRRVKDDVMHGLHVPYAVVELSRGSNPALPRHEAEVLLLKLLESRDGTTAKHTLMWLGEFGSRAAIPAIARWLEASDPDAATSAAWTLASLGAREYVPKMIDLLGKLTREREYGHLARILARMGAPEAVERLAVDVQTRPADLSRDAFEALLEIGAPQAKAEVLRRLKAPDPEGACQEAARLGLTDAIPILLDLKTPAADLALVRLGRKEGLKTVVTLLDLREGWRTVELLAESGLPEAGDVLRDRLKTGKLTPYSAPALAALGVKEAIPLLRTWLDAGWEFDRVRAIEALARLGDRESIPRLRKILREDWPTARAAAAGALADLGVGEAAQEILPLLWAWDPRDVEVAVQALVALGARSAIPELEKALARADRPGRIAAAAGLCELGSQKGIAILLDEEKKLESLNALRSPAAWSRLRSVRLSHRLPLGLDVKAKVEALAGSAGFKVEWSPGYVPDYVAPWNRSLVEGILGGTGSAVVEDGLLRVLSTQEALGFWRAWAPKP
jgi:HEAT repeat protein